MSKQDLQTTQPKPGSNVARQSHQFDFFTEFFTNTGSVEKYGNTIWAWDSIPKFSYTKNRIAKLRERELLDPEDPNFRKEAAPDTMVYTIDEKIKGKKYVTDYEVTVTPAQVRDAEGNWQICWPGRTEQKVSLAIDKLFADQLYGFHGKDGTNTTESWVKFTYRGLQKVLDEEFGVKMSIARLKRSIKIMLGVKLEVKARGDQRINYNGSIFTEAVEGMHDREDYLDKNHDALCALHMPAIVTKCVDQLRYRQYNTEPIKHYKSQLAIYIYQRLVDKYSYANTFKTHTLKYTSLKSCSHLLNAASESSNRKEVIKALDELVKEDVLLSYDIVEEKTKGVITEVTYTVQSAPRFSAEQVDANKRLAQHRNAAARARLDIAGELVNG